MIASLYRCLLSCILLPLVGIFTSSKFWILFKTFRQHNGKLLFNPDAGLQKKNLLNLIKHAVKETGYYSEKLPFVSDSSGQSLFQEFKKFPRLLKSDIESHFPDQITSKNRQNPPWRYISTSGTIERLTVINDFLKRDYIRSSELLGLYFSTGYVPGEKLLEIPPDICTDVCGAVDVVEPGISEFIFQHIKKKDLFNSDTRSDLNGLIERQLIQRKTVLPSFPAGGTKQDEAVLNKYFNEINLKQPYVIKALPAYLNLIAHYMNQNKCHFEHPPKAIMPMGGGITKQMKRVIEKGFNCPVLQDYGCAEMGTIASEHKSKSGLQTFQALFYVEIINQDNSVSPGEIGRLLITDLFNYAMPMIRYDIGDVARLLEVDEVSGNVQSFEILGRISDCIRLDSGKVLTPDIITDFMLAHKSVLFFQLELTRTAVCRLDIVVTENSEPDIRNISVELSDLVENNFKIKARSVKSIQPEGSGKYRLVKNACIEHQVLF